MTRPAPPLPLPAPLFAGAGGPPSRPKLHLGKPHPGQLLDVTGASAPRFGSATPG
jgi:hypothetical protein